MRDRAPVLAVASANLCRSPLYHVAWGEAHHHGERHRGGWARLAGGIYLAESVEGVRSSDTSGAIPPSTMRQNASVFSGGSFGSNFERSYPAR